MSNTASSREQLLHLLAEASELEHNLLCSYLFALFSLKSEDAPDLLPAERLSVGRWRKVLLGVCVEEMLHLAQVANLTVALGALPHFNRPNLPVAAGYHPAAVVVELTKFDLETLQHFIHLERPEGSDIPDGASFIPDVPYKREAHAGLLMPASPDYLTIGEFYSELHSKMRAFCAEHGETRLFAGMRDVQMRPEEVRSESLFVVRDLKSATAGIEEIVRQGEGTSDASAESHFAQFTAIKQEYESHLAVRPDFAPAHNVGRNPVMRFPVAAERTQVTNAKAFLLLDASNAIYGFMLRCLADCYQTGWQESEVRSGMLTATFTLMRALAIVGSELAKLPAYEGQTDGPRAGVSFAMMRSTERLSQFDGYRVLLHERASELLEHVGELPLSMERSAELRTCLEAVARAVPVN